MENARESSIISSMETYLKPNTPRSRKPLRYMTDKGKSSEIMEQPSPATPDCKKHSVSRLTEDPETSDEDDEHEDCNEIVSKSYSSDTSSEPMERCRERGTSESPLVAQLDNCQQSTKNVITRHTDRAKEKEKTRPWALLNEKWIVQCGWGLAILMLTVAVYIIHTHFYLNVQNPQTAEQQKQDRIEHFKNDLRAISIKFPKQKKHDWLEIRAGVENVINSSAKPWIFVLFSNETSTIMCLAKLLGEASSKALLSESSLILTPKNMGNEYGDAIHRLQRSIEEKKVVVVHDLLNIDPGAIQAFHTMCDRENPLVKEAVYIITIIAPGYTTSEKPEVFVENLLINRFANGIHEDKIQPLVTRLTDGSIIPVVSEKVPTGC